MIITPKVMDGLKHEAGHYICARSLGIPGKLLFNSKGDVNDLKFVTFDFRQVPALKKLEDSVVILLGGKHAEDLCRVKERGFYMDYLDAFKILNEIYKIRGEPLPYESIGMSPEYFKQFDEQSRSIVTELGKEWLETEAEQWAKQLSNLS